MVHRTADFKAVRGGPGDANPSLADFVIFRFPNRRKTFVMMNYIAHKVVRHQ